MTLRPRLGEAEKPIGEWNEIEIRSIGPDLTYLLNGKIINEAKVSGVQSFYICIVGRIGSEVRYRNIRLRPAGDLTTSMLKPPAAAGGTGGMPTSASKAPTALVGMPPVPSAAGRWLYSFDSYTNMEAELKPDGTMVSIIPPGHGNWSQSGSKLTINWPAPHALGGALVHELTLIEDGNLFEGQHKGSAIRGARAGCELKGPPGFTMDGRWSIHYSSGGTLSMDVRGSEVNYNNGDRTPKLGLIRFPRTELVARLSGVGLDVASEWLHVRGNQQELASGLLLKRATTSESRSSRLNWPSR